MFYKRAKCIPKHCPAVFIIAAALEIALALGTGVLSDSVKRLLKPLGGVLVLLYARQQWS